MIEDCSTKPGYARVGSRCEMNEDFYDYCLSIFGKFTPDDETLVNKMRQYYILNRVPWHGLVSAIGFVLFLSLAKGWLLIFAVPMMVLFLTYIAGCFRTTNHPTLVLAQIPESKVPGSLKPWKQATSDWVELKERTHPSGWGAVKEEYGFPDSLTGFTESLVTAYVNRVDSSVPHGRSSIPESAPSTMNFIALKKRFDKVNDEWLAWNFDILKVVEFPLLSNLSNPVVREFHRSLNQARNMDVQPSVSFPSNHPYVKAVSDLEVAWAAALSEAHRVRLSTFSDKERNSLEKALTLLRVSLDSNSTAEYRQSAYLQARKSIGTLINIPNESIATLSQSIGLPMLEGNSYA